ncbi:MAG: YbbR-like domain-containing protein [Acidobacteria bacterium]|nr:YbbR-like domain-containing protein [Acidobacteriota bacterium]
MIRAITRNLGLKLFSLATAFILWVLFSGARELTTSVPAPVQYRNIPQDLEISTGLVEQVHLIVRGPSPLLSKASLAQVPVVIDLGSVRRPGVNTFTILRANVSLPSGVILERAVPAQIQIGTEPRVAREVPVLPVFENPPEGTMVASWTLHPDKLTVVGASSRIAAIESVHTDPVDLRAVPASGEVQTVAFTGDGQVHFTASPQVVLRVKFAPSATK